MGGGGRSKGSVLTRYCRYRFRGGGYIFTSQHCQTEEGGDQEKEAGRGRGEDQKRR